TALCIKTVDANDDAAKINSNKDVIKNVWDTLGNCIIIYFSKVDYRTHSFLMFTKNQSNL
ncbi:MAG: hypothetical protein ACJ72V_00245, partial [Nitrososphaeraceae archaeon]